MGLRVSPVARFLCPHRVRFTLRASDIRTIVRVILPLPESDIEGLWPFSTQPPSRLQSKRYPRRGVCSAWGQATASLAACPPCRGVAAVQQRRIRSRVRAIRKNKNT